MACIHTQRYLTDKSQKPKPSNSQHPNLPRPTSSIQGPLCCSSAILSSSRSAAAAAAPASAARRRAMNTRLSAVRCATAWVAEHSTARRCQDQQSAAANQRARHKSASHKSVGLCREQASCLKRGPALTSSWRTLAACSFSACSRAACSAPVAVRGRHKKMQLVLSSQHVPASLSGSVFHTEPPRLLPGAPQHSAAQQNTAHQPAAASAPASASRVAAASCSICCCS